MQRASLHHIEGCQDGKLRSLGVLSCTLQHVVDGVRLHLLAAYGRVGVTDTCKEQTEIFVYFGGSANCASRISRYYLLFYGNCRWQTLDIVAFGFAHSAKILPGVRRKRLYITSLAFGIQCVESQR